MAWAVLASVDPGATEDHSLGLVHTNRLMGPPIQDGLRC